ncbi:MAG: preprotein translocase subunit SecY [Nanoarchaeota archaeon]
MSTIKNILMNLPEVAGPTQKKLPFKEKLKWSITMLVAFFILGMIPLYGMADDAFGHFEQLQQILASQFGTLISLGIGPIVTASIVLQLLNGSGIVKFDTSTSEGKRFYQGIQKSLAFFFVVFESFIFVYLGGFTPKEGISELLLVGQLILGGLLILFMDEVVSKWGIGSGIGLFIVGGVSKELVWRAFSPLSAEGDPFVIGHVWQFFQAAADGQLDIATLAVTAIGATLLIFAMAVFLQAMKIEIPLSFGRVRGQGVRWPLKFIYTGVIPVILVAALFANFQLWAGLLDNDILGNPEENTGIVSFLSPPGDQYGLLGEVIQVGFFNLISDDPIIFLQALVYTLLMALGCMAFSYFWAQTAGMDARSQAKQMMSSGLQIPGFRKDQRVLERLLARYINPLAIMSGFTVGFLASFADMLGALSQGTGILLAVMIIYKIYEEIAKDHMMDMHPALRKFME